MKLLGLEISIKRKKWLHHKKSANIHENYLKLGGGHGKGQQQHPLFTGIGGISVSAELNHRGSVPTLQTGWVTSSDSPRRTIWTSKLLPALALYKKTKKVCVYDKNKLKIHPKGLNLKIVLPVLNDFNQMDKQNTIHNLMRLANYLLFLS